MRGMRLLLMCLFVMCGVQGFSFDRSTEELRQLQYKIFLTSNYEEWKDAISKLESIENKSFDQEYLLALSYYGWLGPLVREDRKKEAKEVLAKAKILQKQLLKNHPKISYLHSLNGAMIGLEVAINHWKAPFLGKSAISSVERSLELDPKDPTGWLEKGNLFYYLPKGLGGDLNKALEYYKNAWKYFNNQTGKHINSWLKLQTGAMIVTCYMDLQDSENVERFLNIIMKKYPGFYWVEDILYPRYMTNHKSQK